MLYREMLAPLLDDTLLVSVQAPGTRTMLGWQFYIQEFYLQESRKKTMLFLFWNNLRED